MIPIVELANGGDAGIEDEQKKQKLETDFDNFSAARAKLTRNAVHVLIEGGQLSIAEIYDA